MSLSSLTPDFRESLRKMADDIAKKTAPKEEAKAETIKPIIRIASEFEVIEEVSDEGTTTGG
jgi:hypothetical protein